MLACVVVTGCSRNPRLNQASYDKIQAGMTIAEVEAILGPGESEGGDLSLAEGAVPAGAVGIGGEQTGIYPAVLPGGWHLIGRTEVALFDPLAASPTLLRPGDRVRFVVESLQP